MNLRISSKSITKHKNSVEHVIYEYKSEPKNIRDLLAETVQIMVTNYKQRQEVSDILKILSKEEIENQSKSGKIGFGRLNGERTPDMEEAVRNAEECFEDGLVVIIVDGERKEKLEDELNLHEESEITFIRMTMLSGRMW